MSLDNKDFIEDDFNLEDIKVNKRHKEPTKTEKIVVSAEIGIEKFLKNLFILIKEKLIKAFNKFLGFDIVTKILVLFGMIFIFCTISFISVKVIEKIKLSMVEVVDYSGVERIRETFGTMETYEEFSVDKLISNNYKQFDNLRLRYNNNEDIVGYLSVFDTNINTPIVQTGDNTYYQDHNIYGQEDMNGAVYVDATSELDELGKNTVVYGRTDIKGQQLYDLSLYDDYDFYSKNRFINLDTIYGNTVWEVFSFYKNSEDNFYLKTDFKDEEFSTYLASIKNLSKYDIDTNVTIYDKILTLTSSNKDGDVYVLHAKLVSSDN